MIQLAERPRLLARMAVVAVMMLTFGGLIGVSAAQAHLYACTVSPKTPVAMNTGFIQGRATITCNAVQPGTSQWVDVQVQERRKFSDGTYSNWEPVGWGSSHAVGSYSVLAHYPCLHGRGAQYRTRIDATTFHGTETTYGTSSGYAYLTCRQTVDSPSARVTAP